jgi:hypothetical protein
LARPIPHVHSTNTGSTMVIRSEIKIWNKEQKRRVTNRHSQPKSGEILQWLPLCH